MLSSCKGEHASILTYNILKYLQVRGKGVDYQYNNVFPLNQYSCPQTDLQPRNVNTKMRELSRQYCFFALQKWALLGI